MFCVKDSIVRTVGYELVGELPTLERILSALHKKMITWRATHGAHKATTDQEAEICDGVRMAFYHPAWRA